MIVCHNEDRALDLALEYLKSQKIFVYPTDTLYGFGADASSVEALDKLYQLKQRPQNMPLSILVSNIDMLKQYAELSGLTKTLIEAFLPGALTLVLPSKSKNLPQGLYSMEGYLGFRIPDHKFCSKLSHKFNSPFITTSVNISGQAAMNDIESIKRVFSKDVDLMIRDERLDKSKSELGSTVVLIDKASNLKILREGRISEKEIRELIR
ncbi:MAG: L-threonylcarbamoyladenylate synthase [Candidatus Neomarinimicrobiota bacterium]|jgi:tRNA threonylcarbamoyl adenosine modification protein (Sua5/YciO/YrdC/YwlC family)